MRIGIILLFALLFTSSQTNSQDREKLKELSILSLEELMELRISTAGKKEQKINQIPASIVIITRQEIKNYGYKSLNDILSNITGLYLWDTHHSSGKTTIGIRGYTSPGGGNENTIILVNGVDQIEGVYDHYLLSKIAVPVEAIDRIEIVRGPMSVLYGSGAFFGAINIITNHNFVNNSSVNLSAGYGTDNTQKVFFNLQTRSENISLKINCGIYTTDGNNFLYSETMSNPAALTGFGLNLNSQTGNTYKEKNSFINLSAKFNDFSAEFIHTIYDKGGLIYVPTLTYSPFKMTSTNIMLTYEKEVFENFRIRGKISSLSSMSLVNLQQLEPDSYISFAYNSGIYEFEVNAIYSPSKTIDITAGLFHKRQYYANNPFEGEAAWGTPYANVSNTLYGDSDIKTNACFLQVEFSATEKLKIIGGLRLEQMMQYNMESSSGKPLVSNGRAILRGTYNLDEIHPIGRIGVIYSIDDKQTIKFLYGEALRHPSFGQLADQLLYTADNSSYKVPLLEPAQINTFEINYNFSYKNILLTNFSIFYNNLHNIFTVIYSTNDQGNVVNYATNLGKMSTTGCEAVLKLRPLFNWDVELSASYQNTKEETPGFEDMTVPYSPDLLLYFKSSFILDEKYIISANAHFTGSMEPDYSRKTKKRIGQKTDAYFVLDANFRIEDFLLPDSYLNFKISNLFDSIIHLPVNSVNSFADKGLLNPGRSILVTLGYNF